ncbi:MAG: prolipoprotein diacylglyceryl transferase [Acidimicrobiia bacterium]
MLSSIPSPSDGVIDLGPLPIRAYGLLIATGVLAAAWLAERRWVKRGGDPGTINSIAIWVVIGGVVGARVYHVIADYQLFTGDWLRAFKIWEGGLSIWGAVGGGALAIILVARRHNLDTLALMDAIAPCVALAQAIGRWGNYFNQELFGRPTNLPWGLEIDPSQRPRGYEQFDTFHPTFLYESIWSLLVFGVLLAVERKVRPHRGQLLALYVALYTFGRFWFELLRVDPPNRILAVRVNVWVSALLFLGAVAWLVVSSGHAARARATAGHRTAAGSPRSSS